MTAGLISMKRFVLIVNNSSIVETFMVSTRNRCQRYCANATAKAARSAKPKRFARTLEAVVIYDCGATRSGPSASFPLIYRKSRRCAIAIMKARNMSVLCHQHCEVHTEKVACRHHDRRLPSCKRVASISIVVFEMLGEHEGLIKLETPFT